MKVLLTNMNCDTRGFCYPPLSLVYVGTMLEKHGHDVKVIDAVADDLSLSELIKQIKAYDPDVVGAGLFSSLLKETYEFTNKIREELPNAKIILGGTHVNEMPVQVLKEFNNVDFLLRGDSELSALDLMEHLQGKKDVKDVSGLAWRRNGNVICNMVKEIEDLDSLPMPNRELLAKYYKTNKYRTIFSTRKVDAILTSRGCAFKCKYCHQYNKSWRWRGVQSVIDELIDMHTMYGVRQVELSDDHFAIHKKRAYEIFDGLAKEKMDLVLRIRSRVDSVNKEFLEKAKKGNVYSITYGMESGVQQMLDNMGKGTTVEQNILARKITKEAGVECWTSWFFGYPGETPETMEQTTKFILKLHPEVMDIGPLTPLPGTKLYWDAKRDGTLINDWSLHKPYPWVKLPWMNSLDDLNKYVANSMKRFYMHPKTLFWLTKTALKERNTVMMKFMLESAIVIKNLHASSQGKSETAEEEYIVQDKYAKN